MLIYYVNGMELIKRRKYATYEILGTTNSAEEGVRTLDRLVSSSSSE